MENILFCWSGGKDSALALHRVLKGNNYRVAALLTTCTRDYDRISMHGVRRTLLHQQAEQIGLPLEEVFISKGATNAEYEKNMGALLQTYYDRGVRRVAFGDIFLEDLKVYREKNLAQIGMKGLFPLWKESTADLANEFVDLGFKAYLACIDPRKLPPDFAGHPFNREMLAKLPPSVDPCGENGEFHSFVYGGPIFKNEVKCRTAERVQRDNFWFCDIVPENEVVNSLK